MAAGEEIERKFLVHEAPDLDGVESAEIEQGYLALPEHGNAEVRLRRRDDERLLTIKGRGGKVRTEEELALERERFESLWRLTEGRRVIKTRYLIPLGELTVELDVYEGELEGLQVAEVEFDAEEEADAFESPDWFGDEVTGDEDYSNQRLATDGSPRP